MIAFSFFAGLFLGSLLTGAAAALVVCAREEPLPRRLPVRWERGDTMDSYLWKIERREPTQ